MIKISQFQDYENVEREQSFRLAMNETGMDFPGCKPFTETDLAFARGYFMGRQNGKNHKWHSMERALRQAPQGMTVTEFLVEWYKKRKEKADA